jgi:hypothetical protein
MLLLLLLQCCRTERMSCTPTADLNGFKQEKSQAAAIPLDDPIIDDERCG